MPGVAVVDAHHHLWNLSLGRYPWLQQAYDADAFHLGDYRGICQNFLPPDYLQESLSCNVLATVHVEAERDRSEQVAETAWLHDMHAQHGFPNAVVAHVCLGCPETEERLLEHLRYPLVRGIRSKPLTSATPTHVNAVRGKPGSMQDANWLHGLAMLDSHGLSWDLRVPYWHLAEAADVAAQFPSLRIALNHHGFAWDRSAEGLKLWRAGMETLARQPNVHVKLSEFGLRDEPWIWEANARILCETLAIFGWQRCMFASNFPVASLRIGYADLVDGTLRLLTDLPPAQQSAVMGGNALNFYRITSTVPQRTTP